MAAISDMLIIGADATLADLTALRSGGFAVIASGAHSALAHRAVYDRRKIMWHLS